VVVIGYQDRHGEFENIGLLILKPGEGRDGLVDNYLLSCRILGRGLETAVLRWAQRRAALRGWLRLCGQVIETERNTPVRTVFQDAGFLPATEPGCWVVEADAAAPLPAYIKVCDRMVALGVKEPA
jgi:predicted enzyme involved in methoxymalonyl-ACP biosynthesis